MSNRNVVHTEIPTADSNKVDSWFERLDHPLKDALTEVRKIILAVDPRIKESIKWGTPTFSFNGDIVSIQSNAKKFVSLMFHRGAEIPGKHEGLLGTARLVRTMKFIDLSEVKRRRKELESVIKAWCRWKSTGE
ncbi:MAG TPA: DUF1801 domain-containing protein [Anaerolineales bacterium]|nr:DUF1801 domain-containing protein [Anaerolineales bacterium]